MSQEEALADLRQRVRKYEEQYETIQDDSLSYIKVYNLSTKILMNHIYGRLSVELVASKMAMRSIRLKFSFGDEPGKLEVDE